MNTLWTQHLPSEEVENFKKYVLSETNNKALIRIRDVCRQKRLNLESETRTNTQYEHPNWGYMQAHTNGMRQAYKTIEDMLSFTKE